jgi:uncharacterized protein with HEPN domain
MARSQLQYFQDIDEAMTDVRRFVAERTLDDFRQDRQLQYAVERALEIIGEAAGNLSGDVRDQAPAVPWRAMRDLRNIVSHAYHRVDAIRVWRVVTDDIPRIPPAIRMLQKDMEER